MGLVMSAKEIHITIPAFDIGHFVEATRGTMICFRCGEQGHARYQCLSYKVRLCWHHRNGGCREENCQFAHSESELRTPWRARCVRVVRQQGRYVCIGCNSETHTFRSCPLHHDLIFWD